MIAVCLGLLTAFCWGWADVLARHTGQALGAARALLTMMVGGVLGLTALMAVQGGPWPGVPSWWTVAAALIAAAAMLLFYEAMRRGPVSLVSPAAGAYPAWSVLISMALGLAPTPLALAAMALTLAGVVLVARFAPADATESLASADRAKVAGRRLTLALSLLASLLFGGLLLIGQQAILRDGETVMLWWGRLTGVALMAVLVLAGRRGAEPRSGEARPWPTNRRALGLALVQGLLDTGGLMFLYAAGLGMDGALASVTSSAFGVVTVLLARWLYGERIARGQAAGIACVFGGVVVLAATG